MRFEHMDRCSKGSWGQRSPQFVQDYQRSLGVKQFKRIVISQTLLNVYKS